MLSSSERDAKRELLDDVGEDLVRAAKATELEIDAGAGGPLLYSRIRASIAERQRLSAEPKRGWLGLLRAARLAVPAMAVVTISVTCLPRLARVAFWSPARAKAVPVSRQASRTNNSPSPGSQGSPMTPYSLTLAAGTCALSNTQECAISNNELLATLFADDNEETRR